MVKRKSAMKPWLGFRAESPVHSRGYVPSPPINEHDVRAEAVRARALMKEQHQ